ncbi:uncharacterized protein ACBT57_012912 [Dama dama]
MDCSLPGSSVQVHSSTLFCALGVGCLHQHTLPLAQSWLGQWEPWQLHFLTEGPDCFANLPSSLWNFYMTFLQRFLLKRRFFRDAFPDHVNKTAPFITPSHLPLALFQNAAFVIIQV